MSLFTNLERAIDECLKSANIETRPNASHGLWITFLIPVCLCLSATRFVKADIYHDTAVCSISLTLISILFIISVVKFNLDFSPYYGCTLPALVSFLLQVFLLQKGIILSGLCAISSCLAFQQTIVRLLKQCPKSFTLGEAILLVQAVILFLYSSVLNIHKSFDVSPKENIEIIALIIQVGMVAVFYVVATFYCIAPVIELETFVFVVTLHIIGMLGTLHLLLRQSPLVWISLYLLDDWTRIILILYWVFVSVLCVGAVVFQTAAGEKASTSCRKIFHVLAVLVFIPGMVIDYPLMYLATGIAFAAIVALETLRKLNLGWFSVILNDAFKVFSDEKDAGGLSLTPLYLLAGMCCPIWLEFEPNFSTFSGILSVGIGDTVASYIGSHWGKTKWPGSKKSYEGTLASISAQLLFIYTSSSFGLIELDSYGHFVGLAAVFTNAIIEAWTDQVDNLTLPLITYIVLV